LFKDKNYHLNKTIECEKQNIQLIHIFEDEWSLKKDIVKSRLKNILGLTENKIYARKCIIKEVSVKETRDFIDDNHLQGKINSNINIGLFHDNELISLMCFGGRRKILNNNSSESNYELLRFVNKLGYNVIGGASKILKYFIKTYQPKEIISYADRRWSNGNLYEKLNFTEEKKSPPSFYYVNNKIRESRFKYQKHRLKQLNLMVDESLSATDNMLLNGFHRIFDCGTKKYKMNIV
jgi:hypothetical protein